MGTWVISTLPHNDPSMSQSDKPRMVDSKGRVVIPSEIRDELDEPGYFMVALTPEGTVELTPARIEPANGE